MSKEPICAVCYLELGVAVIQSKSVFTVGSVQCACACLPLFQVIPIPLGLRDSLADLVSFPSQ